MIRSKALAVAGLVALAAAAFVAAGPALGLDDDDNGANTIAIKDDCDPGDPTWADVGGCDRKRGNVSRAEFGGELSSTLSLSVIGHQAWRNDPTYLVVRQGERVRVVNEGGRPHTFTEVAQFGGGKATNPALNKGLTTAQQCPLSLDLAAGDGITLTGLSAGVHRFQCCLHPWMRAVVKVK